MPDRYIVAFRDYSNKRVEVGLPVADGLGAVELAGFVSTLEAFLIGASGGAGHYDEVSADSGAKATDPEAQASHILVMEVIDNVTGNSHSWKFPCVDLTIADDASSNPAFIVSNGVTVVNPAHTLYQAFKGNVETDILSKAGNPVTLSRMYVDGR